jgi:hypothetical protein
MALGAGPAEALVGGRGPEGLAVRLLDGLLLLVVVHHDVDGEELALGHGIDFLGLGLRDCGIDGVVVLGAAAAAAAAPGLLLVAAAVALVDDGGGHFLAVVVVVVLVLRAAVALAREGRLAPARAAVVRRVEAGAGAPCRGVGVRAREVGGAGILRQHQLHRQIGVPHRGVVVDQVVDGGKDQVGGAQAHAAAPAGHNHQMLHPAVGAERQDKRPRKRVARAHAEHAVRLVRQLGQRILVAARVWQQPLHA